MHKNTATSKIKKFLYSRQTTGLNTKQQENTQGMFTSRKLVQTLQEIDVYNFMRCYCYGELNRIIVSGEFNELELLEQWEEIQMLYFDEIGGQRFKSNFNIYKELLLLKLDYECIILIQELLKNYYCKPFTSELNELCGTSYEFSPEPLDIYLQEIENACEPQLRYLRTEIKLKEIEIEHQKEEIDKDSTDKEGLYEKSFYENLIEVGDFAKIRLDDKISMFEYCHRIKKLNLYKDSLNKKENE
jgi:hypothetical protein